MNAELPTASRNFSVLMCVYHAEQPDNLDEALESIAISSSVPSQLVLVEDGPIGDELREVIDAYRNRLPIESRRLKVNSGLPAALNVGLPACRHELVARCDSDDINHERRFERQLRAFETDEALAVVGTDITEFDPETGVTTAARRLPCDWDGLKRYARKRNPLNHASVMYRASVIRSLGGYEDFIGFEDYALWARCILAGYKIANIPEPLVHVRAGAGQLARRRGLRYVRREIELARHFYRVGFFSRQNLALFVATRAPVRVLPLPLVTRIYNSVLRH